MLQLHAGTIPGLQESLSEQLSQCSVPEPRTIEYGAVYPQYSVFGVIVGFEQTVEVTYA